MSASKDTSSGTDGSPGAEELVALGLGGAIQATSPQMWTQAPSQVLRELQSDLSNVTVTMGTGEREYLQQILPSWSACQEEILRAMEEKCEHWDSPSVF